MTNNTLSNLLRKLNKCDVEQIHSRPLKGKVEFAKVWFDEIEKGNVSVPNGPHNFYFIKNDYDRYVATVYDMGQELHWYVAYKYRKQGHLTMAMHDVILPHLFQSRKEQHITIKESNIGRKNFKASLSLAIKLGFEPISGEGYVLKKVGYKKEGWMSGKNTDITQDRVVSLKKQVRGLSQALYMVQTEVEMKLGISTCTKELKKLVEQTKKQALKIEDEYWDFLEINQPS